MISISQAENYTAERLTIDGTEVIRLADSASRVEVLVAPTIGNNAYSMKVNGQNILWAPFSSLAEWKAKPTLAGNPFLAPWANRLEGESYQANGKRYLLNPALGNFRRDGHRQPIHGLLAYSNLWRVVDMKGEARSAWVTSRLEFWRYPDLMAQFPFAHNVEMTYRLEGETLEVQTVVANLSTEPLPVAIGFHPYFQIPGVPRDSWEVRLPVREQWVLNEALTPTGETRPTQLPNPLTLKGNQLDDVFSGLVRDAEGRAEFSVEGGGKKISVIYGRNFAVAVVYAPKGREFICFEPMAAITNAFNLAEAGRYDGLQRVAPGQIWRESFWIRATGF